MSAMPNSINSKIIITIVLLTLIIFGIFSYVFLGHQNRQLIAEVYRGASIFSETITKSTRYDMLMDNREDVHRIIKTIGEQDGIDVVRVFNKEGMIVFSSNVTDLNKFVDMEADACYICHAVENPLEQISTTERTRIYQKRDHRMLAMITPIYNEPDCYNATCHVHPKEQRVLGVLDVGMSLQAVDAGLYKNRSIFIVFTIIAILSVSMILGYCIHRLVSNPVKQLVNATKKVAKGRLDIEIPVKTNDEIGDLAFALNKMAKDLSKTTVSQDYLNNILQSMINSLVVIDPDGGILMVNRATEQLLGYKEDELIGKKVEILFDKKSFKQLDFSDFEKHGKIEGTEKIYRTKDGKKTPVAFSGAVIRTSDGKIEGIVFVAQDITKLKQKVKELHNANKRVKSALESAEAANHAKSMFLASMSHEIRTPMNSVIGFADMLMDTELNEEQIEYIRCVSKSGEALLVLINEILDFSKIEAGQMILQYLDFDLEVTAFDVCCLIQPRIGDKPVEILCRIGDEVPAFIKSDAGRIRQVLVNLMGNAIKFTNSGEIELSIDIDEEKGDRLKLHVKVTDTGIGISKDKLETVFEKFQQIDGGTTRKYGGTGLGLAISRQIANLLDGDLRVESELGKGSVFHFTAWVEKSKKIYTKKSSLEFLSNKKILLVDDNENNLKILTHILNRYQIRNCGLKKGHQALPKIEEELQRGAPFDMAILDIQMPDISGYEIANKIRNHSNPKISSLPLLASSSATTKRNRMHQESGFNGFLPKPIQRTKLIKMIQWLLGDEVEDAGKTKQKIIVTQHTLAEEAKHSICILLVEDNPFNQKLAHYMLTKAGYQVDIANNGKEAIEKFSSGAEKYNLIFMDINMPEMDGLEATKILRNSGYTDIPIIAVTADALKEDREMCLKSGMNDYIAKPIKREVVFNMVKKWILEVA